MKKITSLIVALTIIATTTLTTLAGTPVCGFCYNVLYSVPCQVCLSKETQTQKALSILKHIVKLEILTVEQQQELICCGGEETVTTADALCVLKKVVGIECGASH